MMKTRIITAVVAIAAFIPILFFLPTVCLQIVLSIFCAVGVFELLAETKLVPKKSLFLYISCAFALAVPFLTAHTGHSVKWLFLLCWGYMMVAFLFGIIDKENIKFQTITAGFFASLIVPYMFTSVLRVINLPEVGRYLVLLPWVCVWVCDSMALFTGMAIGKHKLAPLVSPKKTVEGAIGGFVFATVGAAVYILAVNAIFDQSFNIFSAMIFGALGSTAGQIGDLAFSLIKREAGIKDYGKLFPGHGGVYDRFDSITFAASFFEIFCIYIYSII